MNPDLEAEKAELLAQNDAMEAERAELLAQEVNLLAEIGRLRAAIAAGRAAFVQRFAADMRECGIHVGLNGICVTCDLPWPCPDSGIEHG